MPPPLTSPTDDERLLRASVRAWAESRLRPRVRAMDEAAHFDAELLAELFAQGWMAITVPLECGGAGGSFFDAVLVVEELSRVDPAAAVIVDVQNTLVANALARWGTPEQRTRVLPLLATGTVGAYALSEAAAGSDAFALQTRATATTGGYRLQGRKQWITNAAEAGLFIVFANADPEAGYRGITAFLLERDAAGFRIGHKEDKLGIRASSTCELLLEDCFVPAGNLLGELGRGYKIAIETLNEGRIGIAAQMLGLAQGAFDAALGYASERRQFGRPIAGFQAVQFQLARMAAEIEAARLLTYNAARLKDAGDPFLKEAAMAKLLASETAQRIATQAVDLYGGNGFVKDYPVEKFYRDAKIGAIYEGTSNLQLQTIAKALGIAMSS
ncbi:MAG TPA: acyl-CoA dehydrogenase family protein [Terriglobales bacterium]|jgi:butyryl-CoA dehydrogenase/short/branched chain acyl-CoA dehydrogenase